MLLLSFLRQINTILRQDSLTTQTDLFNIPCFDSTFRFGGVSKVYKLPAQKKYFPWQNIPKLWDQSY